MASIDLIRASNGAGDAVQATVTSARVIGSTTLKVNDVTNFPEGQFIGTTGTIDNTGVFDPSTLTVFTAHLSGADVEIDDIAPGYADLGNTNGQVLVIKPNTLWADNVADTLAVSHNTDGTLKNNIVSTAKIGDNQVTTAKIADSSVTASKLDFTTLAFGNYSTTEVDTGFKYTDGKSIYKRTFTGSHTTNTAFAVMASSGIDSLVNSTGWAMFENQVIPLGMQRFFSVSSLYFACAVVLNKDFNNVYLYTTGTSSNSNTHSVTLYYTKV